MAEFNGSLPCQMNESLTIWPLIIVIEDCFVPQSAQLVIETISEQSDETCGLLFALAGMKASGEWSAN